jgi:hypothetical protein
MLKKVQVTVIQQDPYYVKYMKQLKVYLVIKVTDNANNDDDGYITTNLKNKINFLCLNRLRFCPQCQQRFFETYTIHELKPKITVFIT